MEMVIILSTIITYLACALASARFWYGRARADQIDEYASKKYSDPVQEFERRDASSLILSVSACSIVWPVVWVFFAGSWVVVRVVGGSKHLSRYEIKQDRAIKEKRIAQLEKELDLVADQHRSDRVAEEFGRVNDRPHHYR